MHLDETGVDIEQLGLPDIGELKPNQSWRECELHWSSVVLIVALFGFVAGVMWLGSALGLGFIPQLLLAMVVVPLGLGVLIMGPLEHRWWRDVAFSHFGRIVNAGHCPSCAFSLDGLTAESDGCVVCPECGAAWRQAQPTLSGRDGTQSG